VGGLQIRRGICKGVAAEFLRPVRQAPSGPCAPSG